VQNTPLLLIDAFVLELLYKIWYNISRKSILRKEISMKSVAMAYYNGAKYIDEQIRSILANMEDADELIISVDDASDGSETILQNWAKNDPRIRIIKGPGKGVVKNFENAIKHCRGDIIFLSDQDDVWEKNKMTEIEHVFEDPKVMAVVHDAQIVDEKLSSLNQTTFEWRDSKAGFWKNMKKNSYIGCCMAVRRSALKRILPIPDNIWIHDQWIGLLAEQLGKVVFIEEPLIYYRRHGGNVTELTHGSITSMIKKRYHMIMEINRRVKEWSEHDKQNKRHTENS
jgi:glycosyltransferase involved in cell wall biosynthesis